MAARSKRSKRMSSGGGGLAIFVGPEVNTGFYNQALYKDGQGPAARAAGRRKRACRPRSIRSEPDLELASHPIFSFFISETNPLIRGVKIDRYPPASPTAGSPSPSKPVEVIARARDKSPLVIEKKLRPGRRCCCS